MYCTQPELGPDLQKLKLSMEAAPGIMRVTIKDTDSSRYEVPQELFDNSGGQPSYE